MTDDIICYCKNVTRRTIIEAIRAGARTLKDIQKTTGAATGTRCKELNPKGICCVGDVRKILKEETGIEDKTPCCGPNCCTDKDCLCETSA